jgi:adenylate kinase
MGLNVIMMGAPGAGKGTQAGRFARERGLPKISTGDMLREAIKAGHPVALEAKARMDRGELVDDDTIIAIVKDRLQQPDAQKGFVLDGFPRTVAQARALDEIMTQRNNGPLIVVDVMVPPEELVRRLAMRRICVDCGNNADPAATGKCLKCGGRLEQRADDDQDVVRERLNVYTRLVAGGVVAGERTLEQRDDLKDLVREVRSPRELLDVLRAERVDGGREQLVALAPAAVAQELPPLLDLVDDLGHVTILSHSFGRPPRG